jgi:4-amino-4-deoxy-L-arabinose transferase-like glycosyltransferase
MTLLGCLLPLIAFRIGKSAGVWAGLVAALFVLSYPEFWVHQTLGLVDLPIALFLLIGATWWQKALSHRNWSGLIPAGIVFGLALASRYQAVILIGWILLADS